MDLLQEGKYLKECIISELKTTNSKYPVHKFGLATVQYGCLYDFRDKGNILQSKK